MGEQVSIRSRFERFPATVKGAFIASGADRDPHQIIFLAAFVRRIGGGVEIPLSMKIDFLNVVPRQDLFLPFEFSTTDLDPGWYTVCIDLEVDGDAESFDDGRRFVVAWPRGSVRRGAIEATDVVRVGEATITLTGLNCGGDTATLGYAVSPGDAGTSLAFSAAADGQVLPLIESSFDAEAATGTATFFPVLRASHELVVVASSGRSSSEPATIKLPG